MCLSFIRWDILLAEVPYVRIQLAKSFSTHSSAFFLPTCTSVLGPSINPAVHCRTLFKHRQYQHGAATRAEPTKSQGTPRSPWKNVLGYCFICISFELCLRSIVGLPGSCAYLLIFRKFGKQGKGRTPAIVLLASPIKYLKRRKPKTDCHSKRELVSDPMTSIRLKNRW